MAILADFFVATPEQATRYAHRSEEPDEGEEITQLLAPRQYKGFTGLQMGILWAILENAPWDVEQHMFGDTVLVNEGEAWLERFPDELTRSLADAAPPAPLGACVEWASTEELSCDPGELEPVLHDLQSLARDALKNGNKSVYLWGCL